MIINGYMVLGTYDGTQAFAINIENSTDVKEILTPDGESVPINRPAMDFADGMLYSDSKYNYSQYPLYYIDPVSGIAKFVRTGNVYSELWLSNVLSISSSYSYVFKLASDSDLINFWACQGNGGEYQKHEQWLIFMSYKQDTLSTINVLDEPVTKTADMTMRITYTISLEEDEE